MTIAILGWGSLIWDTRNLKIDMSIGDNGWNSNGPYLPIEFARISNDGRLTLVIKNGVQDKQVLYSISLYKNMDEAVLDLAVRENCGKNKIGKYLKDKNVFTPIDFNYKEKIANWIKLEQDIDAVIWTNLSGSFKDKIGLDLSETNAVNYLTHLTLEVQAKAEEYIRKAPVQIDTKIRNEIEDKLNWTSIKYKNSNSMKTICKVIFFLLITSCNQNNQKASNLVLKEKEVKIEKKSQISIDEKIINKEKLFLDFWLYMTNNEYYQVGSKLKSKNIISGQNTYSIESEDFNCIFEIHPLLRNDSLISINLISVPDANPMSKCKFLQKFDKNYNDRNKNSGIQLERFKEEYGIDGPEKISSIDIMDIIRLYTKKYGQPLIVKPHEKNSVKIYRWILKSKIIEITPNYGSFSISQFKASDIYLGSALVSIEILYLDKQAFQKEQYDIKKTIKNDNSLKNNKMSKTLKDI